jgi:hypothetical protein
MYHQNMIRVFMAEAGFSKDEQDAIRGRLLKHVHAPDGTIMAACLADIFQNQQHADQFTAAWKAEPGKFMEMAGISPSKL